MLEKTQEKSPGKVRDFGQRLKELEKAVRSGAINVEPLDENAEDDELGEPDEKKPVATKAK